VISVAGATTIGAFAALAETARAVVAMDSGPMHVAAAVGAPTVGIFALQSDEPDRWAPNGPRVAVVRPTYPCPPGHRKETCPDFACVRGARRRARAGGARRTARRYRRNADALIAYDDFLRVDVRAGTILAVEPLPKARKPAYALAHRLRRGAG